MNNRKVTQLELALICIVCVLGILLVSGCTTARPAKTYHVKAFTLVVMEQADIVAKYRKDYGIYRPLLMGYCDMDNRVMYSAYAGDMPHFPTLGHEVYHLPELGGRFHK